MQNKKINLKVGQPEGKCIEDTCPYHGRLKVRGRSFTGTLISANMQKTGTVEWEWWYYLKKYERYEKRRSRVKIHIPACYNAKEGSIVRIMECRPLSKTKNFVIVGVLGAEKGFAQRMEAEMEAKVKKEEKTEEEVKELEVQKK